MYKRLLHGLVLAVMLLALLAIPASADGTPYTDPVGRFTYTPPDSFSLDVKGSTNGVVGFANTDQKTGISIYSFITPANLSLDDYVNQTVTNFKKDAGLHFLSDQPQTVTMDGQDARQIEYVITNDSGGRHYLTTYAFNGNVIGRVTALGPDDGWNAFTPTATAAAGGFHFLTASYPTLFTDGMGRYSFIPSIAWQYDLSASKSDGSVTGFDGFSPGGSFFVDTAAVPNGISLDRYAASAIVNDTKADATLQTDQTSATATTVGGQPAYQWEYFNTANNTRFHHRLVWFYNGPTRYRLSVNTRDDRWDDFLPQAMLAINSFTLAPAA